MTIEEEIVEIVYEEMAGMTAEELAEGGLREDDTLKRIAAAIHRWVIWGTAERGGRPESWCR